MLSKTNKIYVFREDSDCFFKKDLVFSSVNFMIDKILNVWF